MKTFLTVLVVILVLVGGYYLLDAYVFEESPATVNNNNGGTNNNGTGGEVATDSIMGCYVATLGQDVYSLKITAQQGEAVEGTLVFDNFQKDSSQGTFEGVYTSNGTLLGDYEFQSEGTNSIMQVIFKRSGNDFIRGYGPLDSTGTKFADLNNITYDPAQTFKTSASCATSL